MENLEWSEKFSVNESHMDTHHKMILKYLSELQGEISGKGASGKVGETLKALADYAAIHFNEEESLMLKMNFPGLDAQVKQHAYFINEIKEMFKQYDNGSLPGQSVISFLRDWFINHILQEDYKYGQLVAKGNP